MCIKLTSVSALYFNPSAQTFTLDRDRVVQTFTLDRDRVVQTFTLDRDRVVQLGPTADFIGLAPHCF